MQQPEHKVVDHDFTLLVEELRVTAQPLTDGKLNIEDFYTVIALVGKGVVWCEKLEHRTGREKKELLKKAIHALADYDEMAVVLDALIDKFVVTDIDGIKLNSKGMRQCCFCF